MTNTTPMIEMPISLSSSANRAPISVSFVVPVAPYSRLIPYSSTALANTPSR